MFQIAIVPLITLYMQYKLIQYSVKLLLFISIYMSFKMVMDNAIEMVMSRIDNLQFPCMTAYIMNSLDFFPMLNFGLSFYAMIYIGKFFYNSLVKLV